MLIDQGVELTFAHYGVGEVQTIELNLSRPVVVQLVGRSIHLFQEIDQLIIEWAMGHKLQGANRMGHALEVVALSVGKIIHRVTMPFCSGAVVRCLNDAIDDGVTKVHVIVGHVEFGAQHHAAFHRFRRIHLVKQSQVFFYRAIAIGALCARCRGGSFLLGNGFAALLVDISQPLLNKPNGKVPKFFEIV